jgi:hypothetical protein
MGCFFLREILLASGFAHRVTNFYCLIERMSRDFLEVAANSFHPFIRQIDGLPHISAEPLLQVRLAAALGYSIGNGLKRHGLSHYNANLARIGDGRKQRCVPVRARGG